MNWIDKPRTQKLDQLMVTELVNDFPMAYYNKIRFSDVYQRAESVDFIGQKAWRVEGLWEHNKDCLLYTSDAADE